MSDSLTQLERTILDRIQGDFPLVPDPYEAIARDAGCTRDEAHQAIARLRKEGIIRRIGGSFSAAKLGYVSVLVCARVETDRLEQVAAAASAYPEVTHNYEREGSYNLWFTVVADGKDRLAEIIGAMRKCDGVDALHELPALRTFKIRVNFSFT